MPKDTGKNSLLKKARTLPAFKGKLIERLKKSGEAKLFLEAAFEDYQQYGDAETLIAAIKTVQEARPSKKPLQKLGYKLELQHI